MVTVWSGSLIPVLLLLKVMLRFWCNNLGVAYFCCRRISHSGALPWYIQKPAFTFKQEKHTKTQTATIWISDHVVAVHRVRQRPRIRARERRGRRCAFVSACPAAGSGVRVQPTDLQRSVSDAPARSASQRTMRLLSVSTLLLFFSTSGNRDARTDTAMATHHDFIVIILLLFSSIVFFYCCCCCCSGDSRVKAQRNWAQLSADERRRGAVWLKFSRFLTVSSPKWMKAQTLIWILGGQACIGDYK